MTVRPQQLKTFKDAEHVGASLCTDIANKAEVKIMKTGKFTIAVPGGSVLKLLEGLKKHAEVDWSKCSLFYVNHKCVPLDSASATHWKAKDLFLSTLPIKAFPIAVDDDANVVASLYADAVKANVPIVDGLPQFDYMLVGVGADGHIGSLYPARDEVAVTDSLVLSVDKKTPASVTLSLPVMNAATDIRVVMMGGDKKEAAKDAFTRAKAPKDFPVCGLRTTDITWYMDEDCASLCQSANA
jgi:6-phosphogluconolactonase